jgi:AhpD family alkylhydroperoxidase
VSAVRLGVLEHGQRWRARSLFGLARLLTRKKPDEVAMTSMYRPAFFGRPWIALLREVMRGPSAWSPGERELFGAFVSRRNRCPYCIGVHRGTATIGLGRSVTVEMLDTWRTERSARGSPPS